MTTHLCGPHFESRDTPDPCIAWKDGSFDCSLLDCDYNNDSQDQTLDHVTKNHYCQCGVYASQKSRHTCADYGPHFESHYAPIPLASGPEGEASENVECSLSGCQYKCRSNGLLLSHVTENHKCVTCGVYTSDRTKHSCRSYGPYYEAHSCQSEKKPAYDGDQFVCGLPGCGYVCDTEQEVQNHVTDAHKCNVCEVYTGDKSNHFCPTYGPHFETHFPPEPHISGSYRDVLKCNIPECKFSCVSHLQFQKHVDEDHVCLCCGVYAAEKTKHSCGRRPIRTDAHSYFETTEYPSPHMRANFRQCSMPLCHFTARSFIGYDQHVEQAHHCSDCNKYCSSVSEHSCTRQGQRLGHLDANTPRIDDSYFQETGRSNLGTIAVYTYKHNLNTDDIETAFTNTREGATLLLTRLLEIYRSLKIKIKISALMEKDIILEDGTKSVKQAVIYFASELENLLTPNSIPEILLKSASEIIERKNTFVENGSGWRIVNIESFEIKLADLSLLFNGYGRGHLKMPFRREKRGFLNFKNRDGYCFRYCILAALHWEQELENLLLRSKSYNSAYLKLKSLKTWHKYSDDTDIDFTEVNDGCDVNPAWNFQPFEHKNNISINIYSHVLEDMTVVRISNFKGENVINLFLIRDAVAKDFHWVCITNLQSFLQNGSSITYKYCPRCISKFKHSKDLEQHICKGFGLPATKFPYEGATLDFFRHELSLPYNYMIYYKFEAFQKHISEPNTTRDTKPICELVPAAFALVVVEKLPTGCDLLACEYHDCKDIVPFFFSRLFYWSQKLLTEIRNCNNWVVPTQEELRKHESATHCEFCGLEFFQGVQGTKDSDYDLFDEDGNLKSEFNEDINYMDNFLFPPGNHEKKTVIKTYHHEHYSGRYRASICQPCNLRVKFKNETCVVANNCGQLDFHMLLKYMDESVFDMNGINVIAKTSETFLQIEITPREFYIPQLNRKYDTDEQYEPSWNGNRKAKVRLIDSVNFIPYDINTLMQPIIEEKSSFLNLIDRFLTTHLNQVNHNHVEIPIKMEMLKTLQQTIPFPSSYFISADQLHDGSSLPTMEDFNDPKELTPYSARTWERFLRVCTQFKIKTFREYTSLHCQVSAILLAIAFEHFRFSAYSTYNLEPAYMCTMSSFAFQCFLKHSRPNLDYIRDEVMLDTIRSGIRGGITNTTMKNVIPNNERNTAFKFDPNKERTHLVNFDVCGLYAHTMMENSFPHSNFQWCSVDELANIDWLSPPMLNDKRSEGYILTVRLEYPEEIHDLTASLPLIPEKKTVELRMISKTQRKMLKTFDYSSIKSFTTSPKLLLHCFPRDEYTLHYRTLQYYMSFGIILDKIYSGIKFVEKPFLRSFIKMNVEKREKAKTETERSLRKYICNSVYGCLLRNVYQNFEFRFCSSRAMAKEFIASSRCVDFDVVNEHVSIFKLLPKEILLNSPIQVGMSILDQSKIYFYKVFYDKLKTTFPDRATCCYADTDGIIALIKDPKNTLFEDLVNNRQYFDFSKLKPDHPIFAMYNYVPNLRMLNANKCGAVKIEGLDIAQGIFLKSKQLSLLSFDMGESLRNNVVPSSKLAKLFNHDTYKEVVENNANIRMNVNIVKSKNHSLYYVNVNKIAFHALDVCRSYCDPNDINYSLPFNHYKLKLMPEMDDDNSD